MKVNVFYEAGKVAGLVFPVERRCFMVDVHYCRLSLGNQRGYGGR